MRSPILVSFCLGLLIGGPAVASDRNTAPPAPPEAYRELIACRTVADPAERLACFDREVSDVEAATASGDIIVADREAVRQTRRGLFGFRLPSLGIFGGGDDDDDASTDEIREIESTIRSVGRVGYGSWRLTLEDGAVWEQSDSRTLVFDPEVGNPIRIRRGALGSFLANIDGQHAIRMRRVQ